MGKVCVIQLDHICFENLRRTFDKSVVFSAHKSLHAKKSMKIFQHKCGQVVLYVQTLHISLCQGKIQKKNKICQVNLLYLLQNIKSLKSKKI